MNTNKNYFELIDSYLNGEMSGAEATDFEGQLAKDPLLENEFQLQKDIVESIRNFRKAELKASLDAVEVGVGTGGFTTLKIAASIAIVAMLGTGIFYFSNKNEENPQEVVEQITNDTNVAVETEQISGAQEDVQPIATDEVEAVEELPIEEAPAISQNNTETATETVVEEKTTEQKTIQPDVNLPVVVEDFNNKEDSQIAENIAIPENKLDKVTETVLPTTEVIQMKKGKYVFHYQFYNNKLYLYGEFENTYEILELNTPSGISIYMFYKENFYELKQHQKKITALEAIEDASLLEDLKIIRKK